VKLALHDHDHVTTSNLCRTAYVARDVGEGKTSALSERLRDIRPEVEIDALPTDLTAVSDETFSAWIDAADLVIAATDDPRVQGRVAFLSYPRRPTLFPSVYKGGSAGEVLFTLPDETPCFHCVLGALAASPKPPERGTIAYGIPTGQLAAEPALGVDILHVAVCAAKLALGLLLRGTGSSVAQVIDPARSILFVGNSAEWLFQEPLETVWARAERREECVCRVRAGALDVAIDDEALRAGSEQ
jgi:hypothetical protein